MARINRAGSDDGGLDAGVGLDDEAELDDWAETQRRPVSEISGFSELCKRYELSKLSGL